MSGHLCLKWNNHSTAFLNSISKIHSLDKPRYCDATIVSQGKYFPVHRIVLSTCSDYFEELFERMECQHPYIVFKDIEPKDMELLLNYMYQGEVNVVQENLPNLIKAAEALRIKGLAVPDDMPSNKESSGKKRSSTSNGHPTPKRRAEERRKRDPSYSSHSEIHEGDDFARSGGVSDSSDKEIRFQPQEIEVDEITKIKEEPIDPENFNSEVAPGNFRAVSSSEPPEASSVPGESNTADGDFSFPSTGEPSSYIKMENEGSIEGSFDQLSSSWSDLGGGDSMSQPLPAEAMTGQDDIMNLNKRHMSVLHDCSILTDLKQSNEGYKRGRLGRPSNIGKSNKTGKPKSGKASKIRKNTEMSPVFKPRKHFKHGQTSKDDLPTKHAKTSRQDPPTKHGQTSRHTPPTAHDQPTRSARNTKSGHPIKRGHPIKQGQRTKTGQAIKHGQSNKRGNPIKQGQPTKTGQFIKHFNTIKQSQPTKTGQAIKLGQSTKHGQLIKTGHPTKHGQSTKVGCPAKHEQLCKTSQSAKHGELPNKGQPSKRGAPIKIKLKPTGASMKRSNFKCSSCSFRSHLKHDVDHVTRNHKQEEIFVCPICHLRCTSRRYLAYHLRVHPREAKKTFNCPHCRKRFLTEWYLPVHMEKFHN